MPDIQSPEDVRALVDAFYAKLLKSDIAYIFTDVAQIDLEHHLPILYDFWYFMLGFPSTYNGNPMGEHIKLHEKTPLTPHAFETWMTLFKETIDERFAGPKAEEAKQKAQNIAGLMRYKLNGES